MQDTAISCLRGESVWLKVLGYVGKGSNNVVKKSPPVQVQETQCQCTGTCVTPIHTSYAPVLAAAHGAQHAHKSPQILGLTILSGLAGVQQVFNNCVSSRHLMQPIQQLLCQINPKTFPDQNNASVNLLSTVFKAEHAEL